MATPRWRKFHEWEPLIVHTVSRCVRRQPILELPERRDRLEKRLTDLAGTFAIDVLEWAAMTNHLHLGLRTHPHLAMAWSAEEVARRWLTICPNWTIKRVIGLEDPAPTSMEIELAVEDRSLICDWRRRLYDLGWFHKLLKEPCARHWNLQDHVSGHVWQERYFCLPCRTEDQWKATAAYIVLNPVRAGAVDELDGCRYSSITRRLTQLEDELRRGLHANDRTAHERVLLAPAIACDRGREVATMSDGEFSRRVDQFMATLTRRDHAIADAHKAKLDAERFENPAPTVEADVNLIQRAMRRVATTTVSVGSGPRYAILETKQRETETATASSEMPPTSKPEPDAKPRPEQGGAHAQRDVGAPYASDEAHQGNRDAAQVRRLFRTRAKPRPRMPHRDPNVRPPRRWNHWSRMPRLPVLAGLTLTAFIEYVDAIGRVAMRPGKGTLRSDAPRATAKLLARVEAETEWSARDGPQS